MSNFAGIQVDFIPQGSQYCQNYPIVAEIVKIVKVEQGYTIVALRDFTGVENTALIRGRSKPTYAEIGQVKAFSLAGKTGNKGVMYSGFYNPDEAIPAEFQGKRPPVPTGGQQATGSGGGKNGYVSEGKNRGFALSYAKDLVVAGKVDIKHIAGCTDTFTAFLDTGKWPGVQQAPVQQQVVRQPEPEREVAETDFDGVGTGPQESYLDANQDVYGQPADKPVGAANVAGPAGPVQGNQAPYQNEDIPF